MRGFGKGYEGGGVFMSTYCVSLFFKSQGDLCLGLFELNFKIGGGFTGRVLKCVESDLWGFSLSFSSGSVHGAFRRKLEESSRSRTASVPSRGEAYCKFPSAWV